MLWALLGGSAATAGAWSQPRGGAYVRLATKGYFAARVFEVSGRSVSGDFWDATGRFEELSFNLIAEYGVLESLTATCAGSS